MECGDVTRAAAMSEFERVKRACVKRGELFEDPEFPATQASVFYHQTPPFQFVWKRPKEVTPNPTFVGEANPSSQFDISPGKLGDRWFVSCLGCVFLTRGLFYRVVPADQTFDEPYAGIFRFRLWWCGEWREVAVDDRLPTVNNRLVFVHASHSSHFWAALLEKAYAKLHGSYEALKYGSSLDGLADMTGGITESLPVRPESCHRTVARLLEMTSLVTCTVLQAQAARNQPERLASGVLVATNYRVLGLDQVETTSGEPVQLVHLRNPLGGAAADHSGPWSRRSSEWDQVALEEKERLCAKLVNDGELWMSYGEFVKTFSHLEVVHLDGETSRDEPSLRGKQPWQMRQWPGSWQKGVSAGGCRNHADTFHLNPQFQLILSDSEEMVVSLNQHCVLEPKVIGFTLYQLPKNSVEAIGRPFFKKNKSLVNSQYTNSRQVSQRCQLEQGGYLVLPTTFEPAQEASFTLRVYSSKPLKLKLIDVVPAVLKQAILKAPANVTDSKGLNQYEAVFMQLAEEHKTINAFELQELLEAVLPNDYVKSCASLEVCRQVVLTLDSTGSGRLRFGDFKDLMCSLKYWQNVFKNHTKGTTGILRAERLRDALWEVGFQLSVEILSLLAIRYMRKDGTLRFGDFVAAILHLTMAFAMFEKKDPLQNGYVKLTLAEWLKSCLVC